MRLPIILDTDPGIDDAAAIAAALFAPELDLQLMTTVAGNVSVEKTTRNALQLLHFWQAKVPLAQGASMPLLRPLRDGFEVIAGARTEQCQKVRRTERLPGETARDIGVAHAGEEAIEVKTLIFGKPFLKRHAPS